MTCSIVPQPNYLASFGMYSLLIGFMKTFLADPSRGYLSKAKKGVGSDRERRREKVIVSRQ